MARRPTRPQKEINSILSSLAAIRILNATARAPMTARQIAEHLGAAKGADMNQILTRLRRHGWVKAATSINTITPEGRKALKLATAGLKAMASLSSPRPSRSQ
jgi:hypothetical protein